jgi:hypothetical protein
MSDTNDEFDWEHFSDIGKKNHRPHANYFSWETDRAVEECGVLQDFQRSLAQQERLFFREAFHRGERNDPPDCEAKGADGGRVGIEITELVDSESCAAACNACWFDPKEWKDSFVPTVQKIVCKKDSATTVKDRPYDDYVFLIFSDEPLLVTSIVEQQIHDHVFEPTALITPAFLLLSYDPWLKS